VQLAASRADRYHARRMTIFDHESVDLQTPSGVMRTHVFRPTAPGKYPGITLFSEIFQVTGPIRRTAALLAGNGFVVAAPEIFHEFESPGTVLGYDSAGADRGNWCKVNKPLSQYDGDQTVLREWLKAHPACTGKLGSMGICIGGHLSFRNAMSPDIHAAVCFYATDIHKLESHPRGLGTGMKDDSLERARRGDVKAELLMIWGRQDPHVPFEGRQQIRVALEEGGANYQAFEVNGAHAFLRDEGPRYNPVLAQQCYGLVIELMKRKLGEGDLPAAPGAGAGETKH
jgi:carboxymethylenebutenolidase